MPNKVEKLNKLTFSFLWNRKPDGLKRESPINTFANEGLNIVDRKIEYSILPNWMSC